MKKTSAGIIMMAPPRPNKPLNNPAVIPIRATMIRCCISMKLYFDLVNKYWQISVKKNSPSVIFVT
jgi:hypothetical protein